MNGVEVPKPQMGECDNPDAERLKTEFRRQNDQIRRELSIGRSHFGPISI
jgi:hypothetical protein